MSDSSRRLVNFTVDEIVVTYEISCFSATQFATVSKPSTSSL